MYPYLRTLLTCKETGLGREKEVAQPCRYDAQLCRTHSCLVDHYLHHVKVEQAAMEKSSLHSEGDALTGFISRLFSPITTFRGRARAMP